ncbi:MAG: P-type ATPase [Polyangiales bacterium]
MSGAAPPSLRACAACGNAVDPLRAPVVAILEGKFVYFCSADCKRATSAQSILPPQVVPRTPAPPAAFVPESPEALEPEPADEAPRVAPRVALRSPPLVEPISSAEEIEPLEAPPVASAPRAPREDRDGRMLRIGAFVFGLLGLAVVLIDARAQPLRLSLSSLAVALLFVTIALSRRDRGSPLETAIERDLGGPLIPAAFAAAASVAMAWILGALNKPGVGTATAASSWVVLAATAAELVAHLAMRDALEGARSILEALQPTPGASLGQTIQLAAGDRVREDVVITHGELVTELWGSSALRTRRREGSPVPAGALVREGRATAKIVAVGADRAFARLLEDAMSRTDRASPGLASLDRITPFAVGAVVVSAAALGLLSRGKFGPTLVAGIVASAAIVIPPARRLAVRDQLLGLVEACRRGLAFRDADAFVRAAQVRTAIYCARGTILAATPDACDVEEVAGGVALADLLAIAAGAEHGIDHPIAKKILEVARARGVRPVDVRNAHFREGLGVTGELAPRAGEAKGSTIVVGGRALCMRAHVPTAEHEARIADLETRGRDVVLVAKDGRVIGMLVLQSSLRAGALAAVQRVQDVDVDPVLLGGGARDRLDAVGRSVGIEHVRPEILPEERGAEVKRIAQSGGPVAVFGHVALDASALSAADVAVAFDDAGSAPDAREGGRGPASVALAHDQLVTAASVLALSQATRARVSATLMVGLAPVVLAALPVAFGLVRATWAPLAALAAAVALGVRDLVAAALPEGARNDDNRS